jgi:TM2 domain-containing membrane protein YozV
LPFHHSSTPTLLSEPYQRQSPSRGWPNTGLFEFGYLIRGSGMEKHSGTHSKVIGYVLWVFGFTGAHRFYYGKPVTGTIWFFTLGLLLIGWIVDLFLIPSMDRKADLRFSPGRLEYNVAWVLLTFLGLLGIHRMYMGKWITGIIYFLTGGILGIGYIYDYWTLNTQVSLINRGE